MVCVRSVALVAAAFVDMVVAGPAWAQGTTIVLYGGNTPAPVSQQPAPDPRDTPEEIAKDAARDLKSSSFYNKPGATRAQYDADWQACRLIARGSRTPSGSIPYYYNPAVVSPLAAGIGGGIGGLIAGAIAEGQQRRANRRSCLMIRGWRSVEMNQADSARVTAMTDAERSAYFDGLVGAAQVKGLVDERTSFGFPADLPVKPDSPVNATGTVFLGKKIDVAVPITLAPNEAAVVIAFRRPDQYSRGRHAGIGLARYDLAARDVIYRPKDWKKRGDPTIYAADVISGAKNAPLEVQVIRLTPGDYVVTGTVPAKGMPTTSYCFGAPTFHLEPGEVRYVGDFVPYVGVRMISGPMWSGVGYASRIEDARAALATRQPDLAGRLQPAALRNRATYACSAITMDRWDLPGVEALAEPAA